MGAQASAQFHGCHFMEGVGNSLGLRWLAPALKLAMLGF